MLRAAHEASIRRSTIGALSIGTLVILFSVAAWISEGSTPSLPQAGEGKAPDGQGPLPFGIKAPLGVAQEKLAFDIPLPDLAVASAANVRTSWLDIANQQFAAEFATGITMMIKPNEYQDPTSDLEVAAKGINAEAYLVEPGQSSALVIEPGTDSTDSVNPAWVEFVVAGLDVNLYSENVGTDALLEVARSIQAFHPSG